MKTWIIAFFLTSMTGLQAQNVLISSLRNPNEPSIMMDPAHPNVMIAASNLRNYYVSVDTGYTWKEYTLSSSLGVWGDPTILVDTSGNFYFFHLSNPQNGNWIDRIVCQKTSDLGNTWTDGSYTGLNGNKAQDKQWGIIDRKTNDIYLTWTQFDSYGSSNQAMRSNILFSKSTDQGETWSAPVRLNKMDGDCIDSDNTVEGAVPALGPDGEIYVSWAGPEGLVFNKSYDQGNTWLAEEIRIDALPGGWDFEVSGIYRCNGLPVTVCDLSHGPNHGTIYVNWSDQRNGTKNTDVWLSKSLDGGQTWSTPTRVNDDNTETQQFFTWMTVDQTNGHLYFVFYDRRHHTGDSTDVYMALSMDGGATFINKKISQSPFMPDKNTFFGDYTNVTAHDGIVRPIWTRLNNGNLSVWTHIIGIHDFIASTGIESPSNSQNFSFENYPNPGDNYEYVSFKLHTTADIHLSLYDADGQLVSEIIKHEKRGYGTYVEQISLNQLNLKEGIYYLKLDVDGKAKINRMIKL